MNLMTKKIVKILSLALFAILMLPNLASAGTIDASDRWAWAENGGWLDFGAGYGNVIVGDNELLGYAWGENIGWVSLNCDNTSSCGEVTYRVANDGSGNLSGYAWGENIGWINFAPTGGGVSINSSGEFSGYAWGENIGWLVFNCAATDSCATIDYKVKTDWTAQSASAAVPTSGGGIAGQYNADYIKAQSQAPDEQVPAAKEEAKFSFDWPWNWFDQNQTSDSAPSATAPQSAPENIEPDAPFAEEIIEIDVPQLPEILPQDEARTVLEQNKKDFSFLPESFLDFAQKFPQLFETLKKTGIQTIADIAKLKNVAFNLPDLAKILDGGNIARNADKIPAEIIFARAFGIDLPVKITADESGAAKQRIQTIKDSELELSFKPEYPARFVKGVIALKGGARKTSGIFERLFLPRVLAQNNIVSEFDYQDRDGDGIFTASIDAPQTKGEYELITKIGYQEIGAGQKEIKVNLLIDPEGYVFERSGAKETRIPDAVVSLYQKSRTAGEFKLWPAGDYQQENPQTTDATGNYAFLAPAGTYYLKVQAVGYPDYTGPQFELSAGKGIHQNIELKKQFAWQDMFSWQWLMLAGLLLVAILLAVNFWRDRRRDE